MSSPSASGLGSKSLPHPLALPLCNAAMMSLAITINLVPVFLTTLSRDLGGPSGLSGEQLGRFGASTFAGLVVGILVTGPLADRFGAKPFALLGNAFIGAGLLLLSSSQNYALALVAVAIMGLGAGVLDMVLSPIVCALQPERRAIAMNWLHSFYCVGASVTVVIATWALDAGVRWRFIALWLTLLPALVCVGFFAVRIPPLVSEEHERTPLRSLVRQRYFQAALAAIFLGGATELGMAQWLPAYAETTLGTSKWTGGMALLAFSIAMALGRMAAGALGTRIRPVTLMIHCCWTSVILFVLACFLPWTVPALVACVLLGMTGSPLWPTMLGVAGDRFPHGGASMFGLLAALGNLGGIFMPWIVGITADHSNLRWGIVTAAACPFIMALLLLWMSGAGASAEGSGDRGQGSEVGADK